MRKVKASDLQGAALDWAVAKCDGHRGIKIDLGPDLRRKVPPRIWMGSDARKPLRQGFFEPSTDWAQGGPIIEREGICIDKLGEANWCAANRSFQHPPWCYGPTPLVAAMRCYVASKLGDEVEIPEEIL